MKTPEERLSRLEEAVQHRATKEELAQLEARLYKYVVVLLPIIASLVGGIVVLVDRL